MQGVNNAMIIGNCVNDPEIKQIPKKDGGSLSVANFSVATNKEYKGKKTTTFHQCVMFGSVVDNFIADYVSKGSLLYCEGEIQTSEYEKEFDCGQKHKVKATQIKVNNLQKLADKIVEKQSKPEQSPIIDNFDDDIPF